MMCAMERHVRGWFEICMSEVCVVGPLICKNFDTNSIILNNMRMK